MSKQIIISISREYGSGGHEIGRKLAEKLDLPFYDRNLLDEVAKASGTDVSELSQYDEKPKHFFLTRTVRGYSSSPAENIAELQFALLKSKAADDDSFVVIGRCSDEIFDKIPGVNVLKIFISGDWDVKVQRVVEKRNMDAKLAAKTIIKHDKNRLAYHDHFCEHRWGDARSYDLSVNSSRLGIDGTVDMLVDYVQRYMKA